VNNLRKAAEQALDFVTSTQWGRRDYMDYGCYVDAFVLADALRAALAVPDEVAAAVKAEREACAKVCDEIGGRDSDSHAWDAAAAIRARGET